MMLQTTVPANEALEDVGMATRIGPSPAEIRAELARILSQPAFNASARNRRFLTYVIEETLQGRGCRIKAYTVALAVFDRDQDFDPLIDPIVRIEASRLRRAIEHYYLTTGRDDAVRIDIPKGSYVPSFSYLRVPTEAGPVAQDDEGREADPVLDDIDAQALPAKPARTAFPSADILPVRRRALRQMAYAAIALAVLAVIGWLSATGYGLRPSGAAASTEVQAPSILVEPLVAANAGREYDYVAAGLTSDIISGLTRFEDVRVYGTATPANTTANTTANTPGDILPGSGTTPAAMPETDYLLSGTIQNDAQMLQMNIILTDRQSGQHVWALKKQWSLTDATLLQVTNQMTTEVTNALAQPEGVLLDELKRRMARTPAAALTSYECIVKFRQYWRKSKRVDFTDAEACLEQTLRDDPDYAPAYAALALVYLDRYRFNFAASDGQPGGPKDPLAEATRLAERARELEPNASRPYLALSLAYWFRNEVGKSLDLAEQGLALHPNNTELMADLGLRYALLGRWDRSKPLIEEAYRLDPATPSGYHIGQFLYAYMHGDYAAALVSASRIEAPYVVYGHVATAAAYGRMGNPEAAAPALAEIRRIAPDYAGKVRADLQRRNLAPEIIDAVIDGLRKAGLRLTAL